jgi:hypothetical protein
LTFANQSLLAGLAGYSELKILADYERIQVTPSRRALRFIGAGHFSRHCEFWKYSLAEAP